MQKGLVLLYRDIDTTWKFAQYLQVRVIWIIV